LTADLVLSNAKAYVSNQIADCCLAIDGGKIVKIGKEANMPEAGNRMNLRNRLVLPGLIDVHVHLRDEENAYKEGFYSGTAAAAAGGITTVLDMPNNSPATMSVETLRRRMEIAESKILVNVGFYSEFPTDTEEIAYIVKEGAVAFKLYMAEQIGGIDSDDDEALLKAFKILSRMKVPVAVHAEDKTILGETEQKLRQSSYNDLKSFLKTHSEKVESKAVKRILEIAVQTKARLHLCHISTRDVVRDIVREKRSGTAVTCEVTPHHLLLSSTDLINIGTLALTTPPIRERRHTMALWNGITNGWIDILASDHAPHKLEEKKNKSVWNVKPGIPGLETTLPLMLTEARQGRLSIGDIVRLMAENPAKVFALHGRGYIEEGKNADLVVVDLAEKYRIDASHFHSKARHSPFNGRVVEGKPVKTFVAGRLVMDEGEILAEAGSGRIIRRDSGSEIHR